MNKDFPDEILDEAFSVLLLDVGAQVAVLAIFHHDVNLGVHYKAVEIAHNKMTVQIGEHVDL